MIVSHTHRFIFIKTRKTAGTSVEVALSLHCGPADILTRLDDEGEKLRQVAAGAGPQHDATPLRAMTLGRVKEGLLQRSWPKLYDHLPAKHARRVVGEETWSRYTTFSIERNPWDRAVSFYYFQRHNGLDMSFRQFLASEPYLSNFWMYSDQQGRICVDRVLRYESLEADLSSLWDDLGLPDQPVLPRAKAVQRPRANRDYRGMYGPHEAALVAERCQQEIAAFGYSFEGV